jgi:hypothetical protein
MFTGKQLLCMHLMPATAHQRRGLQSLTVSYSITPVTGLQSFNDRALSWQLALRHAGPSGFLCCLLSFGSDCCCCIVQASHPARLSAAAAAAGCQRGGHCCSTAAAAARSFMGDHWKLSRGDRHCCLPYTAEEPVLIVLHTRLSLFRYL